MLPSDSLFNGSAARLVGVSVNYGTKVGVDNVSLDIPRGSFFALVGPNGAGKSTTVSVLTTLRRPSDGAAYVDDLDVTQQTQAVRARIGVVFQSPSLDDDMTAAENMLLHASMFGLSRREARERIETLLKLVDLESRKSQIVKTFSGGMKRRLEIARALIHRPALLFLDEPTIGLDAQTRSAVWEYLRGLNKAEQLTVFFTTHYMPEVEQLASDMAVIDHGRIVAVGKVEEIMRQSGAPSLESAYLAITGRGTRDA